MAGNEIIIDN